MSLVRVQSEEPNSEKPAFEQAFCFFAALVLIQNRIQPGKHLIDNGIRYAFRAAISIVLCWSQRITGPFLGFNNQAAIINGHAHFAVRRLPSVFSTAGGTASMMDPPTFFRRVVYIGFSNQSFTFRPAADKRNNNRNATTMPCSSRKTLIYFHLSFAKENQCWNGMNEKHTNNMIRHNKARICF